MTYILLRNNKESTPLSLGELTRMGLKPEDLVWVEGQSVCWLGPGEIQELRSLVGKPVKLSHRKWPAWQIRVCREPLFPAGKSIPVITPVQEAVISPAKTVLTGYEPVPENETLHPQELQENPEQETVVTATKYSRPLDELKELYAKNLEQRAKKRNTRLHITPQIKRAAFYTGLIAAGVIAGVLIR